MFRARRAGVIALKATGYGLAISSVGFGTWYAVDKGFRRECKFWTSVWPIFLGYQFVYWKPWGDAKQKELEYQDLHDKCAPKALKLMLSLRGLYIKLGQVLSVRPELVPLRYREEFRKLQSEVPGVSSAMIKQVIEEDLGPIHSVLSRFDDEPCGSASIAQAHRATTINNEEVVLKVQYPDAKWQFIADIECLKKFCMLLSPFENRFENIYEEFSRQFSMELDFEQEAKNIMDVHAAVMPKFSSVAVVPVVLSDLCSTRIITMTFLPGPKLEMEALSQLKAVGAITQETSSFQQFLQDKMVQNQAGKLDDPLPSGKQTRIATNSTMKQRLGLIVTRVVGIDRIAYGVQLYARLRFWCSRAIVRLCEAGIKLGLVGGYLSHWAQEQRKNFVKMATLSQTQKWLDTLLDVHGFEIFTMVPCCFNGDPHPGNIIAMPDGRLGLIDYGQCKRLDVRSQKRIARLIAAVAENAPDEELAEAARAAGITTFNNSSAFLATFSKFLFCKIEPEWLDPAFHVKLHYSDRINQFPPDLLMVARVAVLLRGLGLALGYNLSIADRWKDPALAALLKNH